MKAITVANYIIVLSARNGYSVINNLKLQKMLYYCQGFHLAAYKERLFDDPIITSKQGPVVKKVYDCYKAYNSKPIKRIFLVRDKRMNDFACALIAIVFEKYNPYANWQLKNIIHEELSLLLTRQNEEVPTEVMKVLFKRKFEAQAMSEDKHITTESALSETTVPDTRALGEAFFNGFSTIYSNLGRLLDLESHRN